MNIVKVEGKNAKHKVFIYALSTCAWCKMTKQFLKDNNVAYEYVDVDLCTGKEKEQIKREILAKGGDLSYPTLIIDDKTVITGLLRDKIKEALEI